ncbi:MAG TPA: hypothetical protein VIU16_06025, partial [Gaiellaceae bacterium]
TFVYTFTITNSSQAASDKSWLYATIPAGIQITGNKVNRGPGCSVVGTALTCPLDFFPGKYTDTVLLFATVTAEGDQTLSAHVDSHPGDSNTANDAVTVTVSVGTTTVTTTSDTSKGGSTLGRDVARPKTGALKTNAKRGTVAKLRFRIYDDRGVASASLQVKQGTKVVGSTKSGFGPVAYGLTYYLPWRVPKTVRGSLSFCVTARDRAGNVSKTSCAPLSVS